MKVFLGGTCAGWKWRDELQPLLKCDYYNPIVKKRRMITNGRICKTKASHCFR